MNPLPAGFIDNLESIVNAQAPSKVVVEDPISLERDIEPPKPKKSCFKKVKGGAQKVKAFFNSDKFNRYVKRPTAFVFRAVTFPFTYSIELPGEMVISALETVKLGVSGAAKLTRNLLGFAVFVGHGAFLGLAGAIEKLRDKLRSKSTIN